MSGKAEGLFVSWRGVALPVTSMFDHRGFETADPQRAHALVALLPNNQWLTCLCQSTDIYVSKLN